MTHKEIGYDKITIIREEPNGKTTTVECPKVDNFSVTTDKEFEYNPPNYIRFIRNRDFIVSFRAHTEDNIYARVTIVEPKVPRRFPPKKRAVCK